MPASTSLRKYSSWAEETWTHSCSKCHGGTSEISVADFRQWTHDYAVSLGVTIQTTPTPHVGRILVRPPGGGRPLGLPDGEVLTWGRPPRHAWAA